MDYELTILSQAMSEAGREALRLAAAGFETFTKPDQSPVTSADLAVNHILHDRLSTAFPEDGWLSEETVDNEDRLSRKRVWIVDPIDGTRSFVRGGCRNSACRSRWLRMGAERGGDFQPGNRRVFFRHSRSRRPGRAPAGLSQPLLHRNVRLHSSILGNSGSAGSRAFSPTSTAARSNPSPYALALVASGQADAVVTLAGG